jgi:uncharacterized heparinase superfamily protein
VTPSGPERWLLYARTVRHLRAAQVAHRARLRVQRAAFNRWGPLLADRLQLPVPASPGWLEGFSALDARAVNGAPAAEANAGGEFRFLQEDRSLGSPADWEQAGATQLWRYHLHSFEWAWSFGAHPDREWASESFLGLWRSWRRGTSFGRSDAWSPYAVSLRSWVLCGLYAPLVAGRPDATAYVEELALHAGYLRANLEYDLGGNHLIKNLKALAGLGVFLHHDRLISVASRGIEHELIVQVLADGGHYERSPSYHCQVLGDLVDVGNVLVAAGRAVPQGLGDAVDAMRRWLGAMLLPDGDVPLFNDCALVGKPRLTLLEPAPRPEGRLTVLNPSGYVIMRPNDRIHLVADVGLPCPGDLPAHAHADCLSFELAVDGERVIVDSGTSTYAAGPQRQYERSTAAHNTVELDGVDQTEVWGAFRAARRARPQLERSTDDGQSIEVIASHDGYRRLPGAPSHRRAWRVTSGRVEIVDEVQGTGVHTITSRLHLSPTIEVRDVARLGPVSVAVTGPEPVLEPATVATGFGEVFSGRCLVTRASATLPSSQTMTISLLSDLDSEGRSA